MSDTHQPQPHDAALPATTALPPADETKLPPYQGDSAPAGPPAPAPAAGPELPVTTAAVWAGGVKLPPFVGDSAPAGPPATAPAARPGLRKTTVLPSAGEPKGLMTTAAVWPAVTVKWPDELGD